MAKSMSPKGSDAKTSDGAASAIVASGHRKPKLPPLTDEERHKRFVEMAREVDASEDVEDFDRAFGRVAVSKLINNHKKD